MNRNLAYVGLGFVTLVTAEVLNVIWRVGNRVERELAEFGSMIPAATQFALEFRVLLSGVVVGALVAGVLLHRHRRAAVFLAMLGLAQLAIGAFVGLALWLPYRALS